MTKVPFQISARLMRHLGEALISDELVAMIELIKNAYDADANNALVTIDTNYQSEYGLGKIVIEDDGSGMNLDIIINSFLKLATDYKMTHQKFSRKYNRISLGNKGVGRLSLQRLGAISKIYTKMDNDKGYSFLIDWNMFDSTDSITDVLIEIDENQNVTQSGTTIEVYGLCNIELWKEKITFIRFRKEILSILNPYLPIETRFAILFDLDGSTFSSEKYDIELIETLADSIVSYNFEASKKKLDISVTRKQKYADSRLESVVKRMNDLGFSTDSTFEKNKSIIYGNLTEKFTIYLDDISKSYSRIENYILIKDDSNEPYLPGDFYGKYYAFERNKIGKENKLFLDLINGVKLFRNGFRILPYGDDRYEWLDFTRYSQTYSSNIYRAHTVAGYVYINGPENLEKLRELTNRQGLLEDNYGKNFFTILRKIISRIIVDSDISFRNEFDPSISKISNAHPGDIVSIFNDKLKFVKNEDVNKKIGESSDSLMDVVKPSIFDSKELANIKAKINNYAKEIKVGSEKIKVQLETEKNKINEEKKLLDKYKLVLATSIIAESMSHEILKIATNTKNCASIIRKEISNSVIKYNRIEANVDVILTNMQFLYRNASILDLNSYTKRNVLEDVDIKEYTLQIINVFPYFDTTMNNHISYEVSGDSFNARIIKNNYSISLQNLIVNSKYWMEKNGIKNPTIHFVFGKNSMMVYDDGLGISKAVENNLFDAFVTAKPDSEGRGLGLYITKQLLNEMNANIELLAERNEYGNKYKFLLTFYE